MQAPKMDLKRFPNYWLLLLLLLIELVAFVDRLESLRSGKMRRRKMRKENSSRFLFIQNSKRKEYYNNTNAAEIVKSSYFDHEFELGDKISLLCIAKGDPIPRLSWYKDGTEFISHQFSRIFEWKINSTFIKSKLEIDPARQLDAGTYECHANNKYSIDRRTFKADF
jgi:hypothetical protein